MFVQSDMLPTHNSRYQLHLQLTAAIGILTDNEHLYLQ